MKKGIFYIALSTILFSTMEIVLKIVSVQINPIQITFLRFLIGAAVLLPLAIKGLKQRKYNLSISDIGFFAITGFICVVVSMVIYQMAILYSQASTVAVLFSCNPIFVIILAFILLHEKIYKHTIISLIISIAGIIIILNTGYGMETAAGLILSILAAVTFSIYSIVSRGRCDKYGSFAITCFSFLMGSIELLFLIFISRINIVAGFFINSGLNIFANIPVIQGISWSMIPGLMYIGIFVTGLGYTFYFLAMETTSAATASLVFFIKPALAPILALIFIHDSITANIWIGIALILIGSFISFIPGFIQYVSHSKTSTYVR